MTTWKILDVVGYTLFVKYLAEDGVRYVIVEQPWNGEGDVRALLSSRNPFPPDPPAPKEALDERRLVGMVGVSAVPEPPPEPAEPPPLIGG